MLSLAPLRPISSNSTLRGHCWLPLLKDHVLTYGFHIPQQSSQVSGLQSEISSLALLTVVQGPIEYDGGIVLIGPSALMFPTAITDNSIQWHYTAIKDASEVVDILDKYDWKQEPDIERLLSLDAFLGYCSNAHVLAGTKKVVEGNIIAPSSKRNTPTHAAIGNEINVISAFSIKSIFSLEGGGKVIVQKAQRLALDPKDEKLRDRIRRSSRAPILAYDVGSKCAWLVPELSLALHLALQFLNQDWIQREFRNKMPANPEALERINKWCAEAQCNGGETAFEAVWSRGNEKLGLDDSDETFRDLVAMHLRNFDLIRQHNAVATASALKRGFSVRLQGWDFVELMKKIPLSANRELPKEEKKASWWGLSEVDKMIVIFGRNLGSLIAPAPGFEGTCSSWNSVPQGLGLLTASIRCVKHVADSFCENANNDSSDECRWLAT